MSEERGEPIKEEEPRVEREAAVMKFESPTTGIVLKLLALEGDTVFGAGINTAKRPRSLTI
ncbi:MAG: hypothetical protein HYW93_05285 [Thaumarchaeota archaeon]|nr:hypothetical protein [Nitrososphaerota archaeon]